MTDNSGNDTQNTEIAQSANSLVQNVSGAVNNAIQAVGSAFNDAAGAAGALVNQGKEAVVGAIDANGNGEIDLEDFIIHGMQLPGIAINREDFLRNEFKTKFSKEAIEEAIRSTPAKAGIAVEEIDKIADHVIANERNCVSGIATALGMPGGIAMAATIPADLAQYYGFTLRAAQKLMYLYGFPQIDVTEKNHIFDSETVNLLTLCLGAMYGAAGANKALHSIAGALAVGVEKQLLKRALTKGWVLPIVKSIGKWFGKNITKSMFAGFFRRAIPVVGGVLGGTITFLSFGPACGKLKESLRHTILANPEEELTDEDTVFIKDEGSIIE